MNVAFLGLGTMGAPMAAHLLARGHTLAVWNRTPGRAAPLAAAGARVAASPADAVSGAEVVVTMLADPEAVDAVVDALLPGLAPGAILVDMSTVDPACARRSDQKVRAHGGRYCDAPVSGTRKPAVDGTLLIMAAGPDQTVAAARPVLEAMGRVIHLGEVGQGMAMKLCLNGLGAHMITGLCAMLAFGVRQGLDPRAMLEVITQGAFSSPLWAIKGARILARDFTPDFTLRLTRKDQRLVLDTARALDYPMPSEQAIHDLLSAAIDAGHGELDLCGLVRLFEDWAGVTVAAK